MIHGATIRRPKPQRTITDARTSETSQAQAGSERTMAADSSRTRARVVPSASAPVGTVREADPGRGPGGTGRFPWLGGASLSPKPNLVERARALCRLFA